MFTGIIEGIGIVKQVEHGKSASRIRLKMPFALNQVKLGDSIAINGSCLTVVNKKLASLAFDVSRETLAKTNLGQLKNNSWVNVERALKFSDRLDGHLVQGHVDGVGVLKKNKLIKADGSNYYQLEFTYPAKLKNYFVKKGSVAINGISLTINELNAKTFSVFIIPHTWTKTILSKLAIGATVNLEADVIAKYVERLMKEKR